MRCADLMYDFDDVCGRALKDEPLYEKLVIYKIDGKQNLEIQEKIYSWTDHEFVVETKIV